MTSPEPIQGTIKPGSAPKKSLTGLEERRLDLDHRKYARKDYFAGILCIILLLGGILVWFFRPDSALQFWAIIGPMIGSGISLFLGDRKTDS